MTTAAVAALGCALVLAMPVARADQPAVREPPSSEPSTCDPARAARLARALDREARIAARWRWGWAAVFGAAAVGQYVVAAADWVPDGDRHDARRTSLYLGAAKATIGLGARVILPPRIARLRLTGDACVDDRAARAAIAWTAVRERNSMALNVFGGLAVNLSASLYVGLAEDSWTDAGISFGMGMAVSIVSGLTQPRRVWRQGGVDARGPLVAWQLGPWPTTRGPGLTLTGSF